MSGCFKPICDYLLENKAQNGKQTNSQKNEAVKQSTWQKSTNSQKFEYLCHLPKVVKFTGMPNLN